MAYAVIPNPEQKHKLLVQEPNGAWFLPCGEIEAGEKHQEALKRECWEESLVSQQIGVPNTDKLKNISILVIVIHTTNPAYTYEATPFTKKYKRH